MATLGNPTLVSCPGQERGLGADCPIPLPASSQARYEWRIGATPVPGATNLTAPGVTVTPSQTTTYTLWTTVPHPDGSGAYSAACGSVTVQVRPAPIAVISGPQGTAPTQWVYNNDNITLTATLPAGTAPGTGTWSVYPTLSTAVTGTDAAGNATWTLPTPTPGNSLTPIGSYTIIYIYTTSTTPSCTGTARTTLVVRALDCPAPNGSGFDFDKILTNTALTFGRTFSARHLIQGSLTLINGDYFVEPGVIMYFAPYNGVQGKLIIGDNARLLARNAIFTSPCTDMWDGIEVQPNSRGLCIGSLNDNFASPLPTAYPLTPPYNGLDLGTTFSEVSYARRAVTWVNPAATATAPTRVNPVRLFNVRFDHNLRGLTCGVAPAAGGLVAAGSAILNCRFTSSPSLFKDGTAAELGTAYDNYTHIGINLDGWDWRNVPISGNAFSRSLTGVVVQNAAPGSLVNLTGNYFACYLAGVYALKIGSGTTGGLTLSGNVFEWREYFNVQPVSPGLQSRFNAQLPSATFLTNQTSGLFMGGTMSNTTGRLLVQNNQFNLANSIPNPFSSWTNPRRGVTVQNLYGPYRFDNNSFHNLETGLRLNLQFAGDALSKANSNVFQNCDAGITLYNGTSFGMIIPVVFWPQCNSFRRTVDSGAPSVGIRVESGMNVVFDNLERRLYGAGNAQNPQTGQPFWDYMKNRFVDVPITNQRMRYLQNDNAALIRYNCYTGGSAVTTTPTPVPGSSTPIPAGTNYDQNVTLQGELSGRQVGFTLPLPTRNPVADGLYTDAQSCRNADLMDDGFGPLRPALPAPATVSVITEGAEVGPSVPNPVTTDAALSLRLPVGTRTAELVLRAAQDGRVVLRIPVQTDASEVRFSVAELRSGVYLGSVVVDGATAATRRILVSR